jgi:hypothetical protein
MILKKRNVVPAEAKRVSKPVAKPIEEVNTTTPKDLVGKRVSIYWDGEKQWFEGVVESKKGPW